MNKKRAELITITLVTIVCALAYISLCASTNVWMDEAFTATLVHTDYKGVLIRSMQDTLPPLYNILLKTTTTLFGYHIPVMKLTSVVPMILTMLLGATTVRKRFGLISACTFILCITGMPLMLYYGVEIRMYSLGFFFATASGIYAYEVIQDSSRKNYILFTLFSVLAGYSHHFAFVAVGFVYLFLLLYYFFADRKHIIRWFKCLGFTFLLYLPCMVVTLKQLANVSGYFSMPDVTIAMFIQYVLYPYMVGKITGSVLCLVIVIVLLILCLISIIKRSGDLSVNIYSLCCFAVYYGVLIFGTIVSKIMTANIFVDRYLFFSTGLLWLFVAIQVGNISNHIVLGKIKSLSVAMPYVFIGLLLYIGICSYVVEYDVEYSNSASEEIAYFRDNLGQGDILYPIGGHEELECCLPFLSLIANENAPLTYVAPIDTAIDAIEMYDGMTLWVAVLDGYTPSDEELNTISDRGYTLTDMTHFDFDRYKCELYTVTRKTN